MSVYVCLGEGERLRLEIFTPYTMHVIKTCMYAKYQCTLYTIQLVSEFVVREALPHLPAVRVSAGVFFFFVCVYRDRPCSSPSHSIGSILQVF